MAGKKVVRYRRKPKAAAIIFGIVLVYIVCFIVIYVSKANELLGEDKPYEDFESFSDEELPTNSDVLMMLSLYLDRLVNYA